MLQLLYIWEIECEENVHTPESDKRQKANDVFLDPEGFLRFKDSSVLCLRHIAQCADCTVGFCIQNVLYLKIKFSHFSYN